MKEYVLTGEVNGAYDPPNLQEVLTKAEDDVKNGRVAPISETFDDLCAMRQDYKKSKITRNLIEE